MSTPAAAVCITTHNRVDCARINIEIIKLNYPGFWPVVHACSNAEYTPGMEDALVRCEPRPLSSGALNLLQQSVREAHARFAPEFFVHLEGDTWITDPAPILKYMDLLRRTPGAVLAASAWDTDQSEDWRTSPKLRRRLKYRLSRLTRRLGWHWHLRHRDTLATQFFVARNTPEFREFLATLPVPKDGVPAGARHLPALRGPLRAWSPAAHAGTGAGSSPLPGRVPSPASVQPALAGPGPAGGR
ncbi:MAG: hypothetical protein ACRCTU_02300 [Zoogloea sp.]|uniref:hypothetical protein n=1 Tax=Zoogloea sp. TaxID=49181 RepID=UPI003F36366C